MMRAAFALVASILLAPMIWHGSLVAQEGSATGAAKSARGNGGQCQSWQDIEDEDGDFKRNAKALEANAGILCITQDVFEEGSLRWVLQIVQNTANRKGPLWAVPHDNENAAFDTAIYSVVRHGGTVVAVETGGKRNNGKQDPNRNFDAGAKPNTACPLQVAPSPIYTERFLRWWDRTQPIMALHSNSAGGSISIKSKKNGTPFPSPKPIGGKNPDHTLIFVASVVPPARDEELGAFVGELNQRGIHVVYETVSPARNDCSLSNFAALRKIRDYFNVEVVHGDSATQRRIVDVVMSIWPKYRIGPLRERPAPDPETIVAPESASPTPPSRPTKKVAATESTEKADKSKPERFHVYLAPQKDEETARKSKVFGERALVSPKQVKISKRKNQIQVVVGPFSKRDAAARLCRSLMSAGEECSVVGPNN